MRVATDSDPALSARAARGRLRGAGISALIAVVVLGGASCGGPNPASGGGAFQKNRDSTYGQIGDLSLLHVHFATPVREGWQPGDAVPLHLTISNKGAEAATLVGVTGAAGGPVALSTAEGRTRPVGITVEPGAVVSLQEADEEHLVMAGLTARLLGGLTTPVTFTLDTGEAITLAVPAQTSAEPAVRSR